jgi:hypothetical protein
MRAVTKPPTFSSGVENVDKKEEERSNYHLSWRLADEIEAQLRNAFYTLSIDKSPRATALKLLEDTKQLLAEQVYYHTMCDIYHCYIIMIMIIWLIDCVLHLYNDDWVVTNIIV